MPEYIVLSTVPMESLEELIRCKDCKHQRKEKHPRTGGVDHWTYWCDMDAEGLGMDNDFCSMAEKETDDV